MGLNSFSAFKSPGPDGISLGLLQEGQINGYSDSRVDLTNWNNSGPESVKFW